MLVRQVVCGIAGWGPGVRRRSIEVEYKGEKAPVGRVLHSETQLAAQTQQACSGGAAV